MGVDVAEGPEGVETAVEPVAAVLDDVEVGATEMEVAEEDASADAEVVEAPAGTAGVADADSVADGSSGVRSSLEALSTFFDSSSISRSTVEL